MTKTILITGSTDGIGLLTAQKLAAGGHKVLLHGRSDTKLEAAAATQTLCSEITEVAALSLQLEAAAVVARTLCSEITEVEACLHLGDEVGQILIRKVPHPRVPLRLPHL